MRSLLSDDPSATFADLIARGWIDVDHPKKSKLLQFVSREPGDSSELQRLVRKKETEALTAWLQAACNDPTSLSKKPVKHVDLEFDSALIQHARSDQVTRRFTIAIWSQLERCANCHSPDRNAKHVAEHGEEMSWIVPQDPQQTLEQLVERRLIDVNQPSRSELLTKPTGVVEHGAGTKFPQGGQTDKQWTDFLEDYAKTIRGGYQTAEDLPVPAENHRWRSGLHFRITGIPKSFGNGIFIVTFHVQNAAGQYASQPSAISESFVNMRRRWGNTLILLEKSELKITNRPGDNSTEKKDLTRPIKLKDAIPEGTYEVRLLKKPGTDEQKPPALLASGEIKAPWKTGHREAKTLPYSEMKPRGLLQKTGH